MKFNNIDTDEKVFIVAEIGKNYEGDYLVVQELVRRAAGKIIQIKHLAEK